ncbi:MAG: hypothetical protein KKB21_02940 [Nanoarchaeota archaeon]|nr:hypothetical protein [Nanoarchaeota archaeon]MBU4086508.1 hypothetical protein [Nanoarchaeota archaeon]
MSSKLLKIIIGIIAAGVIGYNVAQMGRNSLEKGNNDYVSVPKTALPEVALYGALVFPAYCLFKRK